MKCVKRPVNLDNKNIATIYGKGVTAHGEGLRLDDCPYEGDQDGAIAENPNAYKIRAWRKGWLAAEAERLKKSAAK